MIKNLSQTSNGLICFVNVNAISGWYSTQFKHKRLSLPISEHKVPQINNLQIQISIKLMGKLNWTLIKRIVKYDKSDYSGKRK